MGNREYAMHDLRIFGKYAISCCKLHKIKKS